MSPQQQRMSNMHPNIQVDTVFEPRDSSPGTPTQSVVASSPLQELQCFFTHANSPTAILYTSMLQVPILLLVCPASWLTSIKPQQDERDQQGDTRELKALSTWDEAIILLPCLITCANWSEGLANPLFPLNTMEDFSLKSKNAIIKSTKRIRPCCSSFLLTAFELQMLDVEFGKLLSHRKLQQCPKYKEDWDLFAAKEFGRLSQGIGSRAKGTETIFFIPKNKDLANRLKDVTYDKFVCKVWPEKSEPNWTKWPVGSSLVNFSDEVGAPTEDMQKFYPTLSFQRQKYHNEGNKRFLHGDSNQVSQIYAHKTQWYLTWSNQQIQVDGHFKPQWICLHQNQKSHVWCNTSRINCTRAVRKKVHQAGYHQDKYVPSLWYNEWHPVQYTLIIDDFSVKYVNNQHAKQMY